MILFDPYNAYTILNGCTCQVNDVVVVLRSLSTSDEFQTVL